MSEDAHDLVCSGCGKARDRGPDQRYCRACKTEHERERRKRRAKEDLEIALALLRAAYGQEVPRGTQQLAEKRCKDVQ